jgi:HK97 family phage major capsid protein
MTDQPTFETKGASDIANIVDEMMRAFEAFKETNDRRLAELETTRGADALTTEKLMRLDRRLDELTLKAARPHLASPNVAPASPARREHKSAFDGYVRKGDASALVALEGKALSVQSSPDGGYLVPPETETAVLSALKAISPIRSIATIRQVSATVFKKPFSTTAAGTGWVGEIAARPETTTPTLAELQFPTMELYAMPAASPVLLDDAAVDVDSWLADEVRDSFAQQEGNAFVVGNGVNKPKGFLDYPKVAAASYTWGNVGFIATGVAGAFPAANPSDKLIDLVYATKSPYRANGTFVLNRSTMSVIRKFKDAQGLYIWQPSLTPGQPASLLGYPVVEAEDMPNIATDSYALAFGDFRRGYLIVDRIGLRVLRDPYSSKPYVLFYTTKRVGGGIQDFDAIKLMKFGV